MKLTHLTALIMGVPAAFAATSKPSSSSPGASINGDLIDSIVSQAFTLVDMESLCCMQACKAEHSDKDVDVECTSAKLAEYRPRCAGIVKRAGVHKHTLDVEQTKKMKAATELVSEMIKKGQEMATAGQWSTYQETLKQFWYSDEALEETSALHLNKKQYRKYIAFYNYDNATALFDAASVGGTPSQLIKLANFLGFKPGPDISSQEDENVFVDFNYAVRRGNWGEAASIPVPSAELHSKAAAEEELTDYEKYQLGLYFVWKSIRQLNPDITRQDIHDFNTEQAQTAPSVEAVRILGVPRPDGRAFDPTLLQVLKPEGDTSGWKRAKREEAETEAETGNSHPVQKCIDACVTLTEGQCLFLKGTSTEPERCTEDVIKADCTKSCSV